MEKKLFYGWYIVATAFWANFMSTGTSFYIFNAFMEPLCEIRHWDRTEINLALATGSLFAMFSQLPLGALVMRIGPRIPMFIGPLVAGLSFIFLGRVEAHWLFYFLFIMVYTANASYGGIVAASAVNNWFVLKKGKALGISQAGISTSGAILPFLAMLVLIRSDLQTAFLGVGLLMMSVGPICLMVVRNWPEDLGLAPDGEESIHSRKIKKEDAHHQDEKARGDNCNTSWPPSLLIRTPAFWKIGIAFAMVLISIVGVMSQLKPRFSDMGFSDATAMGLMAATAALGAAGKYIWGSLCDRFDVKNVVSALMASTAAGLAVNLLEPSIWSLFLFVVVFGFSMGGVMSTFPISVAEIFGRESFPAVFRFVALFQMIQMLGYIISGLSRDNLGSYSGAYVVFIALAFGASLLMLTVKRPLPSQG